MKRKLTLAIALVAVVAAPVYAQKRSMTFDDVLSLKNVSDAQVSPDGKWVTYVVSFADMKENTNDSDIWLVSTAGGNPIRLTTSNKPDNQPRWSPDSMRLAFISARLEKPQIFVMSPFGGEAEKLTDSKSGIQSFQWSPDGARIAYVAQQEPTPEEEKKQKEKDDAQVIDKDFKFARIWIIDVASKKAREVVKGEFTASDPQWSPDGKQLAYVSHPTPRADDGSLSDIWLLNVDTGQTRKLTDNEGPDSTPRWSPDGKRIAYLSGDLKNGVLGQARLVMIAVEGGRPTDVASGFEYQPGAPVWDSAGNIYFTSSVRSTSQLFSVPASGGTVKQLSNLSGVMGQASFSKDRSVVAFTHGDVTHPDDVYVSRSLQITGESSLTKLTDHNPQVRELTLGRSEVTHWKSKDGKDIEGVLIYPVDYQAGKRYPTIALIHGGPSGVWSQSFPGSHGNYGHVWAGKGWVVFYPNVRGSSAYGEKFLLSNVRDWGGGDFQDIQSGLDDLVARGISDQDKLGQSGWSYGGYMTAWTLTQTNRFKAVMVGAGLTNMISMYSTNDLQRVLEDYFGGQPWDNYESYWKRSAMAFIKQAKTPTLIMQGGSDTRVPPSQAHELYMGLKKNNVPVELVVYPREPHGLQEPHHRMDKMKREYAWFSKWVLGVEVTEPKPDIADKKGEEKPSSK